MGVEFTESGRKIGIFAIVGRDPIKGDLYEELQFDDFPIDEQERIKDKMMKLVMPKDEGGQEAIFRSGCSIDKIGGFVQYTIGLEDCIFGSALVCQIDQFSQKG